ncbi:up-regulator of cell proliferation [Pelomyxa schiedti]|nr:up-regulator of cell proliferation [Pelomyxa schiedti]
MDTPADWVAKMNSMLASCQASARATDCALELRARVKSLSVATDTKEKEMRRQLAETALEPEVVKLLTQLIVTDLMEPLVVAYCTDLDTLAQASCDPSRANWLPGVSDVVRNKLRSKLEIRSLFPGCSRGWLKNLLSACTTKEALQGMEWSAVEGIAGSSDLGVEEKWTVGEKEKVKKLWVEGNPLRMAVEESGLELSLVGELQQKGVKEPAAITQEIADSLAASRHSSNQEKSNLTNMVKQHGGEGKSKQQDRERKREQLLEATRKAAEAVSKAKEEAQSNREGAASRVQDRLNEATNHLKIPEWHITNSGSWDPTKAMQELASIEGNLQSSVQDLACGEGNYERDETVISNVSGGLALCGVSFGNNVDNFGKRAHKPVLARPEYCPLKGAQMPYRREYLSINSSHAIAAFHALSESSGHSLAVQVCGGYCGVSVSAGFAKADSTSKSNTTQSSSTTTAVAVIQSIVHPTASFRIPQDQMVLSTEAEWAAKSVNTTDSAIKFMNDFGSHVSDGLHHLGGLFYHTMEMTTQVDTRLDEMQAAVSDELSVNAGVGFSRFGAEASCGISHRNFSASATADGSQKEQRQAEFKSSVTAFGPASLNPDIFDRTLEANNKSWRIIDRGTLPELVPIWEIMGRHSSNNVVRAARLVQKAWLDSASHLVQFFPVLSFEVEHVRMNALEQCIPCQVSARRELLPQAQQQAQSRDIVKAAIGSAYRRIASTVNETGVLQIFLQLLTLISQESCVVQSDLLLEFMADTAMGGGESELKALVENLSARPPKQHANTRSILRQIFQPRLVQLDHNHIAMSPAFMEVMNNQAEDEACLSSSALWSIPKVEVPEFGNEVRRLKTIQQDRDMEVVCARLIAVLDKNIVPLQAKIPVCKKIIEKVKAYGLRGDCFTVTLTEEGYDSLAEEIDEILSNNARAVIPSSPKTAVGTPILLSQTSQLSTPTYSRLLVDRPLNLDPQVSLENTLLDCLRHRLELPGDRPSGDQTVEPVHAESAADDLEIVGDDDDDNNENNITLGPSLSLSVYDSLARLLLSHDSTGQAEIFRLILERRCAAPLLVPSEFMPSPPSGLQPFCFLVDSLKFVDIVGTDGAVINVATDQSALRVAVVSECRDTGQSQTGDLLQSVFNVHSFRTHCFSHMTGIPSCKMPILEIGCGFILAANQKPLAVMVAHVIGNPEPLQPFLEKFTELLVIEAQEGSPITIPRPNVMGKSKATNAAKWNCNHIVWLSDPTLEIKKRMVYNATIDNKVKEAFIMIIRGSVAQVSGTIASAIVTVEHRFNTPEKDPLQTLNFSSFSRRVTIDTVDIEATTKGRTITCETLRKSFILQSSFQKEGASIVSMRSPLNKGVSFREEVFKAEIRKEQQFRQDKAIELEANPWIKCFVGILQQASGVARVESMLKLNSYINKQISPFYNKLKQQADAAWNAHRADRNNAGLKHDWSCKKEAMNSITIHTEHFWREISHMYTANPERYNSFIEIAVQHLLDGFPLELLDGDAGFINEDWIYSILSHLHNRLSMPSDKEPPRIFVLSVLGVQSCGKSTLFNIMFGTRLRASVGQCTRGVNMQLIRCIDRKTYDYILLLDTEGVRAPETSGLEGSEWRDNRLATIAILVADATIVLNANEDHTAIKDMLPIVLTVYAMGSLNDGSGSTLSSKLFFVYNRINTSEAGKTRDIQQKLLEVLDESVNEVERFRQGAHLDTASTTPLSTPPSNPPPKPCPSSMFSIISDLKLHSNNEAKSDIRILGQNRLKDFPPHDVPNTLYGQAVVALREHMHSSMVSSTWQPRTVNGFKDHLRAVWSAVVTEDFGFSFRSIMDRTNYSIMEHNMMQQQQKLAVAYSLHYSKVDDEIKKMAAANPDEHPSETDANDRLDKLKNILRSAIAPEIASTTCYINEMKKDPRFSSLATGLEQQWSSFLHDQKSRWERLISSSFTSVIMYGSKEEEYRKLMRHKIEGRWASTKGCLTDHAKRELFQQLFDDFLLEVNLKNPSSASRVTSQVLEVYRHFPGLQIDLSKFDTDELLQSQSQSWLGGSNFVFQAFQKVWNALFKSTITFTPKQEGMLNGLANEVVSLLCTAKMFNTGLVNEAIEKTNARLRQFDNVSHVRQKAHTMVFSILCTQLTEVQKKWDEENSVGAKMRKSKETFRVFFDGIFSGLEGKAMLIQALTRAIEMKYRDAFVEYAIKMLTPSAFEQPYIGDFHKLMAHGDLELIEHIGNFGKIQQILRNTQHHLDQVQEKLLDAFIGSKLSSLWLAFWNKLKEGFELAAAEAKTVTLNRTEMFMKVLRQQIATYRPIWEHMPVYSDSYRNCDNEPPQMFDGLWEVVTHKVPLPGPGRCPVTVHSLVSLLLAELRTGPLDTAVGAVRPRCCEPCPICESPCMSSLGHSGNHDTYHQPLSLTGWHMDDTKMLMPETCVQAVRSTKNFKRHCDTEYRPYAKWTQYFPNWDLPAQNRHLELREYIALHFNTELAGSAYKPATNIPAEYARSIESITQSIKHLAQL